nr:hypothetical protein [uncultured Acetobacter sp.]
MSNNQMPANPFGKPYMEELRTDNLHPESMIGTGDDAKKVEDIVNAATGAVQVEGGDASSAIVTVPGTPVARKISDIASDTAHLDQYRVAAGSDTVALTNANNGLKNAGRRVLRLPPGQTVTADGSSDAQTLGNALLYGDGSSLDGAPGFAAHDASQRSAFNLYKTITPDNLAEFHAVCARSQADNGVTIVEIVIAGDSLPSEGDNQLVSDECAGVLIANVIGAQVQEIYPAARFQFINRCCAGSGWQNYNDPTFGAPQYFGLANGVTLRDSIPTDAALIIWNCGGNNSFGLVPSDITGSVSYQASRCPSVSQVFVINPSSSITPTTNTTTGIDGVQWAYSWLYSFCRVYGYGYVDVDSWVRMRRDGYYPHAVSLQRLQSRDVWFDAPITLNAGVFSFPDTENASGVSASACTDFHVILAYPTSTTQPGTAEIRLGGGGGQNYITRAYLGFNGGANANQFSLTVSDGVNPDRTFVSDYVSQTAPVFGITVKDDRLRIIAALPDQSKNGFDPTAIGTDQYPGASIGLGFFEIFNIPVVRWRAAFQPSILNLPTGVKLLNIAVADASRKNPTVMPVRPDLTMYGLYDSTLDAGGNDIAHMNSFGWRETMVPPFEMQNWRPALASGLTVAGATTATTVTINNVPCLKYPDQYHMDIYAGYMSDGASGGVVYNANRRAWAGYMQGYSWHSFDGTSWSTPMYLDDGGNLMLKGGIGFYNTQPPKEQPILTLANATDGEKAIANFLGGIGLCKLVFQ